jgi:FKBP-type peptidyl-prolyl cis-trans isomerase
VDVDRGTNRWWREKRCEVGDWATVHWKASLDNHRVVADTRAQPGGQPTKFVIGASEVFKSWDLVFDQLRETNKATITSPSYLAWGDAFTPAPIGGEPIPLGSNITFDIEVLKCERTPTWTA